MYRALVAQPVNTAWLIPTGAMTNAALLFSRYPEMKDHISGVSMMGGAIGGLFTFAPMGHLDERIPLAQKVFKAFTSLPAEIAHMPLESAARLCHDQNILSFNETSTDGRAIVKMFKELASQGFGNWTRMAEFNIYTDPEAAQQILEDPMLSRKTVMAPLDLTHQVTATESVRNALLHGANGSTPLRVLFNKVLTFFASTYLNKFGMEDPPVHDPVAVAAVFAPQLFQNSPDAPWKVKVILEGDSDPGTRLPEKAGECGRTVIRSAEPGQGGVGIPVAVDNETFWELIGLALESVEAARAS